MIHTSSRLLRLLSLLWSRPSWSAEDLARRTDVTQRTVRRDIARLRELGYDVVSEPGRGGGYRLSESRGGPPLVLDDEEVLAVSVALREAAQTRLLGDDQAVLSALLKLRELLPARVASRLGAMDDVVEHVPRVCEETVPADVLAVLAQVCRHSERIVVTEGRGSGTVHEIDPFRLVFTGSRWYLVAREVTTGSWGAFRADLLTDVRSTGRVVRLQDPPDAARLVAETIENGAAAEAAPRR
ncbi:helix-turn-helix transcriptional regulator [Promicromonospora thailandica]|uniref:WYL domain-containing protein n=1 Tax=Promicromonospora thailandica TaxID=765201 RepID=A0A9X2GBN0_9MICO|nr:HTH domain-containing protein [Promicromonospora thailandica]MCP2265506.1 WYL domain-containing protein [Promicromonospora thailandica]